MRKNLFKTYLVAIMALMGTTAWAQTTTLLEYGTAEVPWTEDNLTEWTAGGNPAIKDGYVEITGGNGSYSTSKTIAPTANAIINVQAVWRAASSTGRAFSAGNGSYFRFGNIIVAQNDQDKKHGYGFTGLDNMNSVTTFSAGSYRTDVENTTWLLIDMEINTASNTLTSFSIKSEDGATTYASAENVALTNTDYTTVAFGYRKAGGVSTTNKENLKSVKITQTAQTVETADYTINYLLNGEGTPVKVITGTIAVGASVETEANFFVDEVKYFRADGQPTSVTVTSENKEFNINIRLAATYNYTIQSNLGTTVATGTGLEGESFRVGYPRYQLADNVLYQAAVDNKEYRTTVTLSADNVSKTVNYTAVADVNAVFYTEAEDVEGVTVVTNDNIPVRASNAKAAVTNDDVTITTLPAGKYKFHVGIFTSKSNYSGFAVNFGIGNEVFAASFTAVNLTEVASEEYELQIPSAITFMGNSSNGAQFDYMWIEKTGDAAPFTPAYGEIWSGTKAFPVEEYESISLNTAYFKDFVKAGDVIKVTLQPAAEEARAEAPMRDIKRFGELALLAADESIIAEEGELALDTEDYSFTVEESWIEKLSTGNNIYLRGRNLTVTKIELLEAVFEPVDCTAKVSTENWLSEQGSVGGPVTLEGIAQKEQYNASTTAIIEGDVLYQVVEGLQNGTYKVELYANASFTSGRGFTSDIIDGQLGRVVVYAGDVDKTIPVFDQGWVNTNNIVTLENVVVSDGTLRMGLKKIAPGTNWHTIQIKSLTQVSNKAEADADAQDTYWKGIAATVAAYEAYANVAGSEKAAIVAAETKAAAQAAIPPFYAAKPSYDALADIIAKANSADYDVAEAEALMASTETTAEQAAAKAAELLHPVTLAVNTKAVEGASKDNPIETNFVVNGTFDTAGVIAPWKSTTGAQNQTTANNQSGAFGVENSFFFENWNPDPFTGKMYQVIEDIPNGLYTLKICAFVNTFDATAQYVYANTDQTPLTTGEPTAYEVQTNVTTNTIEIGLEQIVAVANWMGVDNVSLIYKGDGTATAINEVTAKQNTGNAIYNLQGQKVQNARKGLYIINGKKVLK